MPLTFSIVKQSKPRQKASSLKSVTTRRSLLESTANHTVGLDPRAIQIYPRRFVCPAPLTALQRPSRPHPLPPAPILQSRRRRLLPRRRSVLPQEPRQMESALQLGAPREDAAPRGRHAAREQVARGGEGKEGVPLGRAGRHCGQVSC